MRLGHIANHVTRLARWEQVALPEDLLDSLREFIGRIRHRRTVYEAWGFDAKMSTSRGLSALFYGPPGTGKSMVAGLIARELGLELYRVDLARIVSKWIGETEKNLAEVFDAAEDGQVVILFDEADSLFAKRTEVKSSVDRYANLEVNYLLQRLDSFEGICILTTNLEGSIDQAFKRRMSLRLQFPFPDEDMRVRLWASHLPARDPDRRRLRLRRARPPLPPVRRLHPQLDPARRLPRRPGGAPPQPGPPRPRHPARVPRARQAVDDRADGVAPPPPRSEHDRQLALEPGDVGQRQAVAPPAVDLPRTRHRRRDVEDEAEPDVASAGLDPAAPRDQEPGPALRAVAITSRWARSRGCWCGGPRGRDRGAGRAPRGPGTSRARPRRAPARRSRCS